MRAHVTGPMAYRLITMYTLSSPTFKHSISYIAERLFNIDSACARVLAYILRTYSYTTPTVNVQNVSYNVLALQIKYCPLFIGNEGKIVFFQHR